MMPLFDLPIPETIPNPHCARCASRGELCGLHRPPDPLPHTLARTNDPQTSHDAAAALTGTRVDDVKRNIRALFVEWGEMSDGFLIILYRRKFEAGITESTVRTRRHEMVAAGELCDSGKRTADRRPSTIWKRS